MSKDNRRRRQGIEQVGELDDQQRLRPRQLDRCSFASSVDAERSLGADEQAARG